MIEIRNNEQLQRWLLESGHLAPLWDRPRFLFDPDVFDRELAGVREQYPQFTTEEAEARAALRLMGKEEGRRSAARPAIAGPRAGAGGWNRRERLLLGLLIALAALLALLLCAPRAHAQDRAEGYATREMAPEAAFERYRFYNHLLAARPSLPTAAGYRAGLFGLARGPNRAGQYLQGGQPGGIIIQLASSGTVLATMPAGLLQFNCATGMSCSFAAGSGTNPPTFTLSSTGGGGGSGCIPPGSIANALLFDAGGGACSDVAKFTWNGGTSTLALASGGIFDPTAGTMKVPGTSGQLLFNNSGALGAEDPVVSGPDARGAAQTKNPVAGLAGLDYGTGCAGGPCVQEAKVDASGNVSVSVTSTVPVSGTFWQATQPVSWSGQSVSLTGSWPYSGALGSVSLTGTLPSFASTPTVNVGNTPSVVIQSNASINLSQYGGSNVGQSNPVYVEPTDGTHNQPMGDAVARSIQVQMNDGTNDLGGTSHPVRVDPTGTTTQPVSSTQLPAGLDGSGYLKVHEQGTPNVNIQSNATVNLAQIGGSGVAPANPCLANQPAALAINQASSSTTTIISGASAKHTYLCSIFLISAAAQNVNIVAGAGTNCGSAVHVGFFGGTTAATGPNLAANTGWTLGNGQAVVAGGTDTAADNICIQSSGSGQISGVLTYVQQ